MNARDSRLTLLRSLLLAADDTQQAHEGRQRQALHDRVMRITMNVM
jgi:hypothetical protein